MLLHHKLKGVAFDTNILVAIERRKLDVFSQARQMFGGNVKFVVTRQVMRELLELQKEGKTMEKAVRVALTVLRKEDVGVLETKAENADASLVEAAGEGFCVATLDRALRKRIKEVRGSVIYLRYNKVLRAD